MHGIGEITVQSKCEQKLSSNVIPWRNDAELILQGQVNANFKNSFNFISKKVYSSLVTSFKMLKFSQ